MHLRPGTWKIRDLVVGDRTHRQPADRNENQGIPVLLFFFMSGDICTFDLVPGKSAIWASNRELELPRTFELAALEPGKIRDLGVGDRTHRACRWPKRAPGYSRFAIFKQIGSLSIIAPSTWRPLEPGKIRDLGVGDRTHRQPADRNENQGIPVLLFFFYVG